MITIFGATGASGPHLVHTLVEQGHAVRVAGRDPVALRARFGARVDVVEADVERPVTLGPALAGSTRVLCGVGGARGTPELVRAEGNLIDAARASGVERYVKISGIDSSTTAPARVQRMHGAIEEHLAASGIPSTVLRPGFFMQNFLAFAPAIRAGALPLPAGQARGSLIDARDIADVAAAVLTEPDHIGKTYTLTGPRAVSHAEVASLLSEVTRKQVSYVDVPPDAFVASMAAAGVPRWFAELLADVYATVFASGGASRTTRDVEEITGRPPRTLEAFLRQHRDTWTALAAA